MLALKVHESSYSKTLVKKKEIFLNKFGCRALKNRHQFENIIIFQFQNI